MSFTKTTVSIRRHGISLNQSDTLVGCYACKSRSVRVVQHKQLSKYGTSHQEPTQPYDRSRTFQLTTIHTIVNRHHCSHRAAGRQAMTRQSHLNNVALFSRTAGVIGTRKEVNHTEQPLPLANRHAALSWRANVWRRASSCGGTAAWSRDRATERRLSSCVIQLH